MMRHLLVTLLLLCGMAVPAAAQLGSVAHVFSPNTTIRSSEMNALFSTIHANAVARTGGSLLGTLTTLALLPTTDNASDIGSAALSYNDGWFDGTLTVATLSVTSMTVSTVTCTGCIGATQIASTTVTAAAYGSATAIPTFTVDADGRLTAAGTATPQLTFTSTYFSSLSLANGTGLPISTGVSGLGTGIATALGVNTGSTGAPVLFDGAGGTPSSITLTNGVSLPETGITNGSLLARYAELMAFTTFGAHTITAGGTGTLSLSVRNTTAGTTNRARIQVGNDTANNGYLEALSSTFTTTDAAFADGVVLAGAGAGGLSLVANATSVGDVRIYSRGLSGLAVTFGAGQVATFTAVPVFSAGLGTPSSLTLTNATGLPWAGVNKSGSSLADLATRSVANLSDGSSVALLNAAIIAGASAAGYRTLIDGTNAAGALLTFNTDASGNSTINQPAGRILNDSTGPFFFQTSPATAAAAARTFTTRMTLSEAGLLTVSGFGTHSFSAGGTGANTIKVANTTAGTGNAAQIALGIDGPADIGYLFGLSTTFTTSGFYQASGVGLQSTGSGGLNLIASHANADMRFYNRGGALALTLGASQAATFAGAATFSAGDVTVTSATAAHIVISTSADTYNPYLQFAGYNRSVYIGVADTGADGNLVFASAAALSSPMLTLSPATNAATFTGNVDAPTFSAGGDSGYTGATCTAFTGGICTTGSEPAAFLAAIGEGDLRPRLQALEAEVQQLRSEIAWLRAGSAR